MVAAWEPQRFLAPYAKQFVGELVGHYPRDYPGIEEALACVTCRGLFFQITDRERRDPVKLVGM